MSKRIIVAIDGPAGAGKSTIARRLASRLGFLYIDTGAMYRAVGLWALRRETSLDDSHRLGQLAEQARIELDRNGRVMLNGEDVTAQIRTQQVADAASKASAVGAVRRALLEKQRSYAEQNSVVMEGRDIGTVVFPDAQIKIFLDAGVEVRATRRLKELQEKGDGASYEEISREIRDRDHRDRTRTEAPLMQAPDGILIDTSGLTIEQVEEAILKIVRDRTSNGKEVSR